MTIFTTAMATALLTKPTYAVFVAGIEVTDNYVSLEIARRIAKHYKDRGYEVEIEKHG